MFEIYTKEVVIKGGLEGDTKLKLRPLSGRFLPKLYSALRNFKFGDETFNVMEALDEETVSKLHELCLETLKKSYPNEDKDKLDEFVSQNLMQLFPIIIEVNLNVKPQ